MSELLPLLGKMLVYNCTTLSVLIPNLFFGLAIACVSALCLYLSSKNEPDYFRFTGKGIYIFAVCVGVVLTSPLPFWGSAVILKGISVFVLLVVLFVTSYMDEKTFTFTAGYLYGGLLIQGILLLVSFSVGYIYLTDFDKKALVVVIVLIYLFRKISAHSYGDMMLIYMVLMAFLIVGEGDFFVNMGIAYFVMFFGVVVRNAWRLSEKYKKKEKFRFKFTVHIAVGAMVGLFFM